MPESEAFRLSMEISGAIYDLFLHHCQMYGVEFGGEKFELEDSEMGEPFPLRRVSDGVLFEVWLSAEVDRPTAGVTAKPLGAPAGETGE